MSDNARFGLSDIEKMSISKFNKYAEALNDYIDKKNKESEDG